MEQSAEEDIEVQGQSLCRPVTHTLTPPGPLLTVDGFPGINESSSSYGSKPELTLLTLPPAEDDPSTSDTHPSAPRPPTTTEAERKWKEYIANRSTTPEYFLFPQFTPEQDEWIIRVNHPFKEYICAPDLAEQSTHLHALLASGLGQLNIIFFCYIFIHSFSFFALILLFVYSKVNLKQCQ